MDQIVKSAINWIISIENITTGGGGFSGTPFLVQFQPNFKDDADDSAEIQMALPSPKPLSGYHIFLLAEYIILQSAVPVP